MYSSKVIAEADEHLLSLQTTLRKVCDFHGVLRRFHRVNSGLVVGIFGGRCC